MYIDALIWTMILKLNDQMQTKTVSIPTWTLVKDGESFERLIENIKRAPITVAE